MSGKNPDKPIGYGNPPDHTKFQPGKSGNPNGRPKQSKPGVDIQYVFLDELLTEVAMLENRKEVMMPAIQIIAKRLVRDAMKGSVKALAVFERMTAGFSLTRGLELHKNNAHLAFLDEILKDADKWNA
jgi:hypothetical protein